MASSFPLEFFPDDMIPVVEEVAYCNRFDIDYLSTSILSVCATAIGNSYAIRVKDTWIERPSLWLAIVGLAGISKSHPMSWAMSPIHRIESRIYKEFKERVKEWQSDPEKDNIPKPELSKILMSDATPESVFHQLSINPRGILIHNDELSGFLSTFQRYNKGNDEQFYLTAWSSKPWIVDRKTALPIRITEPVVNINGTIQTSIFEKLFKDKEDSGFADRWLICNPTGVKKEYWTDDVVSDSSTEYYHRMIYALHDLQMTIDEWDNPTANIIEYTPEAFDIIKKWHISNTDTINSTDIETVRSVRAKMEIYVHRFALIAYLLDCANHGDYITKVDEKAAKRACMIADYFLEHIMKIRESDPASKLSGVWKELYDMLPYDEQEFNVTWYMQLAKTMGVKEGSAKSFLSRNTGKLFEKSKRGFYYKK